MLHVKYKFLIGLRWAYAYTCFIVDWGFIH